MQVEKFFNTCVYGLVSLLSEIAESEYEGLKAGCRYVMYSTERGGNNFVCLFYRGMKAEFVVSWGGKLVINKSEGIPKRYFDRLIAVVTDCIGNLCNFEYPISKIEGLLTHDVMEIRVLNSGIHPGEVEVYIGV